MFIRVRHWTTQLGEWDHFVERLEHEGLDAMKQAKGFQRLIVTGDPMSNSVVTISIWESESAERAYETQKAKAFHDVVKAFVTGPPETFAYPVISDREA
jgi:heme-degrading monooxygenase HmoA